jgi:hypothetical protein
MIQDDCIVICYPAGGGGSFLEGAINSITKNSNLTISQKLGHCHESKIFVKNFVSGDSLTSFEEELTSIRNLQLTLSTVRAYHYRNLIAIQQQGIQKHIPVWFIKINLDSTNDNQVDWGGYDNSTNLNSLRNNDEVVTLQFLAKKPQNQWGTSPLFTTNKFAGNTIAKDLSIAPTNGILVVYKISNSFDFSLNEDMKIFPNPTDDYINVKFKVIKEGNVTLVVYGIDGKSHKVIVNGTMPEGEYQYGASLGYLPEGTYVAVLKRQDKSVTSKFVLK